VDILITAHGPLIFVLVKQAIGLLNVRKSMTKKTAGCPSVCYVVAYKWRCEWEKGLL